MPDTSIDTSIDTDVEGTDVPVDPRRPCGGADLEKASFTLDESGWTVSDGDPGDATFLSGWRTDHTTLGGEEATFRLDACASDPGTCATTCLDDRAGCSDFDQVSGEVKSTEYVEYGCLRAKIKAGLGSGLVTGFFFYDPDDETDADDGHDEIDIEIFGKKDAGEVHLAYFDNSDSPTDEEYVPFAAGTSEHTYDILWEPAGLKFYIDGVLQDFGPTVAMDRHMQVILNLWACNSVKWPQCEDYTLGTTADATFKELAYYPLAADEGGDSDTGASGRSFALPPAVRVPLPECEPGSGLFTLAPTGRLRDGTQLSRAIQIQGTGRLTDDAWISDARALSWSGKPMLAMTESIAGGTAQAVPIGLGGQQFPDGAVSGGARFLTSGSGSTTAVMSLGWGCSQPGEHPAKRPVGDGYSFSLSDIGCPVDWPQRFTLRTRDRRTSPFLSLELFGSPRDRRNVALVQRDGRLGRAFSYAASGLKVGGQFLGRDNNVAIVELSEVSYLGMPLCRPGTYQLVSE